MLETFISLLLSTTMLVNGVDGRCVSNAAKYYDVPPSIILALMTVEGGTIGTESKNKNGTSDLGPMQINTIWLKETKLNKKTLKYNGCANVFTGTWILKNEIERRKGNLWEGVAYYHSKTPKYYQKYVKKVYSARKNILIKYSEMFNSESYQDIRIKAQEKHAPEIAILTNAKGVTGISKMSVMD